MTPTETVWYAHPIVFGASAAQIWSVAGPLFSAFLAAAITHVLTRRRDQGNFLMRLAEEAKLASRRIRRERLLSAFDTLDASEPQRIQHRLQNGTITEKEHLELIARRARAFSELNVFGDEELSGQIDRYLEEGPSFDTSTLMNLLRDKLRSEFGLERTNARYKWIEIDLVKIDKTGTIEKNVGETQ